MFKDYKSEFLQLVEDYNNRWSNDGFLQGDYVTIAPNAVSHEWVEAQNDQYKATLKSFINTKDRLKVAQIRSAVAPGAFGSATGIDAVGAPRFLDIVEELAPGRAGRVITVPAEVVELIDKGANFSPPIPDKWKHEAKLTLKPELVGGDENHSNPKTNAPGLAKEPEDGRNQAKRPEKYASKADKR